jgi:hypothetical protein
MEEPDFYNLIAHERDTGTEIYIWTPYGTVHVPVHERWDYQSSDEGRQTVTAMLDSLTSSVDTDVTWTKQGAVYWSRSETRPT